MEKNITEDTGKEVEPAEPYLGTYKDKAAAEEGLANLQAKLTEQGKELGTLRKQGEFYQQTLTSLQKAPTQAKAEAPNYAKEIAAINKQIATLDPVEDPDYQTKLVDFIGQSNALASQQTLEAASQKFKQELDERDIKTAHSTFFEQNPDYNDPDMQMRIREYLAKDKTGMSDELVAYREIQRDDASAAKAQFEAENAELKRLLELKKGEEQTGKVVTKGQSPQQKTKQPKAVGADLDRGMQEALNRSRE